MIHRAWDYYQRFWYGLCDFARTPVGFGLLVMTWVWMLFAALGAMEGWS